MKRRLLTSAAGLAGALTFWTVSSLSHEVVNTTVTYDREIVRILSRKCASCHSEKNLGMPLRNYEQTRPWSRAIEDEVLQRHMPPWRAVEGYGEFINDIGLTNTERQFVVSWVEGNGPRRKDEGFIGYIGESTVPDKLLSPDFTKWQLGKPD